VRIIPCNLYDLSITEGREAEKIFASIPDGFKLKNNC
jgi:hypothetical protein